MCIYFCAVMSVCVFACVFSLCVLMCVYVWLVIYVCVYVFPRMCLVFCMHAPTYFLWLCVCPCVLLCGHICMRWCLYFVCVCIGISVCVCRYLCAYVRLCEYLSGYECVLVWLCWYDFACSCVSFLCLHAYIFLFFKLIYQSTSVTGKGKEIEWRLRNWFSLLFFFNIHNYTSFSLSYSFSRQPSQSCCPEIRNLIWTAT